jgi:hypothetical protein
MEEERPMSDMQAAKAIYDYLFSKKPMFKETPIPSHKKSCLGATSGDVMAGCAIIFLFILFIAFYLALSAIIKGFVLCKMWGWFVVPYFELPALSIPLAIGVSMLVGMLTQNPNLDTKKKKEDQSAGKLVLLFLSPFWVPFVTLGLGAIVKSFL